MKLKEYRNRLNKTQQEIADMLNLQKQTYQNYELGKREPDINTLIKISKLFNTSVDNLIGNNIMHEVFNYSTLQKDMNDVFEQLTEMGQGEVLGYAKKTLEQEKLTKEKQLKEKLKNK